jgi:3-keto steroid reductase
MLAAFYISRLLGSPWHTVTTYLGANAPVWLALSSQEALDEAETPYRDNGGGHCKWGSSTHRFGGACIANTEIDGWGYGGVVDRPPVVPEDRARRRKPGMKLQTPEDRLQFEELGRRSWQYMEELRIEWDRLLDIDEKSQ